MSSKVWQIRGFPSSLKNELKSLAALRDITMLEAAIEAVKMWIENEKSRS